ncbi:recombinase family protein [Vibrio parahaemolyticus]|uniref:recombinase family protein n=1 Tax=Vibrio parahaemolyticus TaxID=670 RepID=UPI000AFA1CCF|nr:recombinase family protein [Vibrio parahaemolyticus]ELB2745716.1 recombinase family protein [Vibrio parahaemolyticus]MEA5263087.1 recombinase family protein [Vibrio parahaemolyticus]
MRIPKIHVYARVSTLGQVESGLSLGLQTDNDMINEYCQRYGTELGKVYSDHGRSAFHQKNLAGKLGDFLTDMADKNNLDVQAGDYLLVRALDRISRANLDDAFWLYLQIMRSGVSILTTMDNREYKPNDSVSQILATLSFDLAGEESRKKQAITLAAMRKRIKQYQTGERAPCGNPYNVSTGLPFYAYAKDNVCYIDDQKFQLAKDICQMALDGKGNVTCRDYLRKHGVDLNVDSVASVFKSECLYGDRQVTLLDLDATNRHPEKKKVYSTFILKDYFPAACTKDEFHRIRAIKDSYKIHDNRRVSYSILGGISRLYCKDTVAIGSRENGGIYKCSSPECACGFYARQQLLDYIVLSCLSEHQIVPVEPDKRKIESIQQQIGAYQHQLSTLKKIMFDNPLAFDLADQDRLSELSTKIQELNNQLTIEQENHAHSNSFISLDDVKNWREKKEAYINGSDEDKLEAREIVQRLVKEIRIVENTVTIKTIDNKVHWYYIPTPSNRRKKAYVKLLVSDHAQNMRSINEALDKVCFTEEDIKNGKHHYPLEAYAPDLVTVAIKSPAKEKDEFELLLETVTEPFVFKRRVLLSMGLSANQYQRHASVEKAIDNGFYAVSVDYTSKNYKYPTDIIVSPREITTDDIHALLCVRKIKTIESIAPKQREFTSKVY